MTEFLDTANDLIYSDGNQEDQVMTTREILDQAFKALGITQKDAAELMGCSSQSLGQKLMRRSLRSDEFLELLDRIGIDVTFTVRDSNDVLKDTSGHGRRVRGNSDGVHYDTLDSEALANDFFEDGKNEYHEDGTATELYVDRSGRYFIAEYNNNGRDKVKAVPPSIALAFIEKYGIDIEKDPKTEDE